MALEKIDAFLSYYINLNFAAGDSSYQHLIQKIWQVRVQLREAQVSPIHDMRFTGTFFGDLKNFCYNAKVVSPPRFVAWYFASLLSQCSMS